MRRVGTVLVIIGALALVYGVFVFNRDRTILEIGSLQVTSNENNGMSMPAVAGAIVLVIGVVCVVIGARGPRRS